MNQRIARIVFAAVLIATAIAMVFAPQRVQSQISGIRGEIGQGY
jgi:hypothetical protein